jgi:tRNA(adenine34) deaminase
LAAEQAGLATDDRCGLKQHHRLIRCRMKWVKNVKTESTFPPPETFNKSAKSIAKTLASPKVSPKGLGSAIRMVQYFINRGGKNLSTTRKRELEKAKHILQEKHEQEKQDDASKRKSKSQTGRSKNETAKHGGKKTGQRHTSTKAKHARTSKPK